ncbi:MAG: hypothetical protein J5565_02415 [Muribaculaceae bacterium]|nr:hypothetical protein [Muribaculaceae bacterium]
MSKRSLLIIILLLTIVDIVAAFWYLAARIEASGSSRDIFEIVPDTTVAEMADTLTETNVPDSFMMAEQHAYYVSQQPAIKGDNSTYFYCVKRVKVRWPKSVNGSSRMGQLEHAMLEKMFPMVGNDLEQSINMFLGQPSFNSTHELAYNKIDFLPASASSYSNRSDIVAFPVMTSMRLLVMGIEKYVFNGIETITSTAYVHYDRGTHRLLEKKDIFAEKDVVILGIINAKIDQLNREKGSQLQHASTMPEFQAKAKGISFHFPTGIIAAPNEGPIEVFVDYPKIKPALTTSFKRLVAENTGFWDYKHVTID